MRHLGNGDTVNRVSRFFGRLVSSITARVTTCFQLGDVVRMALFFARVWNSTNLFDLIKIQISGIELGLLLKVNLN